MLTGWHAPIAIECSPADRYIDFGVGIGHLLIRDLRKHVGVNPAYGYNVILLAVNLTTLTAS